MFGAYRLILAAMVAASHLGFNLEPFEPGRFAVVNFFVISGFVMTKLYHRYFVGLKDAPAYYFERAIRILPQYYFFMLLALACVLIMGPPANPSIDGTLTPAVFAGNALIVPLNFYPFIPSLAHFSLIPQAFTLGLEILFYIAVPFLVIFKRLRFAALLASAVLFGCAFFGIINNDIYGYRLLPGTLIFFLAGIYMADDKDRFAVPSLFGSYAFYLALSLILVASVCISGKTSPLYTSTNVSVLAGAVFGLPFVRFLSKLKVKRLDVVLGSASYGTFLCHIIIIWWLPGLLGLAGQHNTIEKIILRLFLIATSIGLGYVGYLFVEKPFVHMRHRMREKARKEHDTGHALNG